jgi:Flp pilus assembly protein TadG
MRLNPVQKSRCRGVAAVELAVLLPLLVGLLLGVWEVGRMVEVSQLLTNAVREGARQASEGSKNTAAVQTDVINYLNRNGISNVTTSMVTFQNLTNPSNTDPSKAAQLDHLRVSISVPFNNVRWILLNQITNAKNLNAQADWYSMNDLPLAVNDVIPLN